MEGNSRRRSNRSPISFHRWTTAAKKEKQRRGKRGERKEKIPLGENATGIMKKSIQIFNLSKYKLNPYEQKLLEKVLFFCPTHDINNFHLFLDLHRLTGNLTLKRYFSIQKNNNKITTAESIPTSDVRTTGKYKDLKYRSTFYPSSFQGNYVETFH